MSFCRPPNRSGLPHLHSESTSNSLRAGLYGIFITSVSPTMLLAIDLGRWTITCWPIRYVLSPGTTSLPLLHLDGIGGVVSAWSVSPLLPRSGRCHHFCFSATVAFGIGLVLSLIRNQHLGRLLAPAGRWGTMRFYSFPTSTLPGLINAGAPSVPPRSVGSPRHWLAF